MTTWHSARPVPWLRFEGKGSCEWHLAYFFPRGVPPALALAFLRSSLQVIVQFLFMTWPRFFFFHNLSPEKGIHFFVVMVRGKSASQFCWVPSF